MSMPRTCSRGELTCVPATTLEGSIYNHETIVVRALSKCSTSQCTGDSESAVVVARDAESVIDVKIFNSLLVAIDFEEEKSRRHGTLLYKAQHL